MRPTSDSQNFSAQWRTFGRILIIETNKCLSSNNLELSVWDFWRRTHSLFLESDCPELQPSLRALPSALICRANDTTQDISQYLLPGLNDVRRRFKWSSTPLVLCSLREKNLLGEYKSRQRPELALILLLNHPLLGPIDRLKSPSDLRIYEGMGVPDQLMRCFWPTSNPAVT